MIVYVTKIWFDGNYELDYDKIYKNKATLQKICDDYNALLTEHDLSWGMHCEPEEVVIEIIEE